jgi:acetylornithine deacetylase/succinyl-diaminopimelate desuccinylase-like protein
MLAAVVPGPDGSLRDELRAGIEPPAQAERESWARLPPGDQLLRDVGARPAYPGAGAEYYERNGADASLEINAIHAGEPRTVVPAVAHASVSQRLAPGQNGRDALATLERLLRAALPAGAELELTAETGEPSLFPPDNRAIALSAQALERAVGAPTAFVRSGGSIPVVAEFAARDIPTVVSGFGLEDDAYHAPDESFRLVALDQGAAAADELYRALAAL